MGDAVSESDKSKRLARPLLTFGLADACVQRGQFNILECGGARKQVETQKNETDFSIANGGQFFFAEAGDFDAFEQIAPGAGFIEAAQNIHERRFPAAAGAHDGDEFPARNFDTYASQGVNARFPELIVFVNLLDQNYRFAILRSGETLRGL